MLKSILVAVDGTKASDAAQALSIDLSKRLHARVAGIGVLDRPWITAPQATPIGASYYKTVRDQAVLKRIDEQIETLLSQFEARCREAGVEYAAAEWEGDPEKLIEVESETHDLIVVGKDTTFHFRPDGGTSKTVVHLARDDPRPVIVTPDELPRSDKILLAFDGSLPASRAMHMFALLGLAAGRPVEVLSVAKTAEGEAKRRAVQAAKVLRNHDVDASVTVIESAEHPAGILIDRSRDAALLVMGAFGHKKLRDFFFGSCTERLLDACPVPLFIHH
ncbi:MAG: universal stress protein [Alphaproteobacteria bacterium]|nr:universal stress protein [Alphaproteobacteria bacterium]